MNNLTRRGMAALALMPLAIPAGAACVFEADAELDELGRRFVKAAQELKDLSGAYDALGWPMVREAERISGVSCDDLSDDRYRFQAAWDQVEARCPEYRPAERAVHDAWMRLYVLVEAIHALPATTIKGLRAKLVVAAFANRDLWTKDELEWDETRLKDFFDSAFAVCGGEVAL